MIDQFLGAKKVLIGEKSVAIFPPKRATVAANPPRWTATYSAPPSPPRRGIFLRCVDFAGGS